MSRRQFEGWGWELSDREFGRALALLGVVADLLATGRGGMQQAFPLGQRRARALVERAMRDADAALTWDLAPYGGLEGLRRLLKDQPAPTLALAWERSWAGHRHLEIRPARGLDDRWLAGVLGGALVDHPPHFALPEPAGRPRWHWPLRIGFAVGDGWLRDRIYDGQAPLSPSVAGLTEPEVGPSRCDVLILEARPGRGLRDIAATALPEAALVVVFETAAGPGDPVRARAIAARANTSGVVLVETGWADQTEWLRTFLRELSHLESVPRALARAGRIGALLAAPRLLGAQPLGLAARGLEARLELVPETGAAESVTVGPMPAPTLTELALPRGRPVPMATLRHRFGAVAMQYASERGGASHVAAVTRAATPALDDLERGQADERFIRATVEVMRGRERVRLRAGFQAGGRHHVAISIGPRDRELIIGSAPIPREALEEAVGHRLTIVLSEPSLLPRPLVGTLELPPFGPTRGLDFVLPVRRSAPEVRARVSVLHRGRILQTAILGGPVHARAELDRLEVGEAEAAGGGIGLRAEIDLRPGFAGLDDRTRFHCAIVLNHDGRGRAGATAMGRERAVQLDLDIVREAVAKLSRVLEAAERDRAFERKLDSAASLVYLRLLALEGRNLHTRVGRLIERAFPGPLERIQVLSANPNTMLPVELVYDLPPPVPRARLCPNAEDALRTGRCEGGRSHVLDEEGRLDVVCPSGFWGISKIIEREATDPRHGGSGIRVRSMPTRRQKTLGTLTPVLFAASDHVNDVDPKELGRLSKALDVLTDRQATRVQRWRDWAARVRQDEPPVLLLLSHTELHVPEGPSLEIGRPGGPEIRAVADITERHVNVNPGRPGPVVLLLGCTTAVPLETFQSFTVQFADMGAAIVIGTIAPVLGRHAGRTAEALIEALKALPAAAGGRTAVPVGEVLRDVRRRMLARGILMSMSLAAYGDADWRLPVEA